MEPDPLRDTTDEDLAINKAQTRADGIALDEWTQEVRRRQGLKGS